MKVDSYESGFEGNHSTCIFAFKLLKGFDKGLLIEMIIDLQKSFGTIDQKILLQKCKVARFSEITTKFTAQV